MIKVYLQPAFLDFFAKSLQFWENLTGFFWLFFTKICFISFFICTFAHKSCTLNKSEAISYLYIIAKIAKIAKLAKLKSRKAKFAKIAKLAIAANLAK